MTIQMTGRRLDRKADLGEQAQDLYIQTKAQAQEAWAWHYLEKAERYPCTAGHDQDPTCECAAAELFLSSLYFGLAQDENTRWRGGIGRPGRTRA